MRVDIITSAPQLLESPLKHFIFQRAIKKQLLTLSIHHLRDYTPYKHGKIDDSPYGGGAGMVLMVEPIVNCIERLQRERCYDEVIYMAPDGELLNQKLVNKLSLKQNIMLLCGHYKGVDERVRTHFITLEISVGDYVLSGGELPALMLTDAIVRVIPGVLSDASSALADSFQDDLVAPPIYTRPYRYRDIYVPSILRSGNHQAIRAWEQQESVLNTKKRRPYLIDEFWGGSL